MGFACFRLDLDFLDLGWLLRIVNFDQKVDMPDVESRLPKCRSIIYNPFDM